MMGKIGADRLFEDMINNGLDLTEDVLTLHVMSLSVVTDTDGSSLTAERILKPHVGKKKFNVSNRLKFVL